MKDTLGKLGRWVIGVAIFLAALATIAAYVEQSQTPPKVAQMFSEVASPELLNLVYRLLFLFAVAIGLWWIEKRLRKVEGAQNSPATAAFLESAVNEKAQETVAALVERREWAVHNLLNVEVPTEREVGYWEAQWGTWRKGVIALLRKVCSAAEVSRFEVVGTVPGMTLVGVSNKVPDHHVSLLNRDLEMLLEIIERLER